jgi:hypothetical protein
VCVHGATRQEVWVTKDGDGHVKAVKSQQL